MVDRVKPYTGKAVVIVGPTGSGKTGAAIGLAKRIGGLFEGSREVKKGEFVDSNGEFYGEIISADSRAIYKGMDLGTAKPSKEEQDGVVHFGLDLVEPDERFTVADFKKYCEHKIYEIKQRGHVPIIAGGTGLYVDSVIFDYSFSQEAKKSYTDRKEMSSDFIIFGIKWEMSELKERLRQRVNKLFIQDLYDETEVLAKRYRWELQSMKSNIYQFAWGYLTGKYSLEEAKELNLLDDYHLAKRQMTWFKRNDKIIWLKLENFCDTVLKYI